MRFPGKLLSISAALAIAATLGAAACAPTASQPPSTQEILAKIQSANATVQTFGFSANASFSVEVVGGNESGKMPMQMDFLGKMDVAKKSMQMTGNITADIPGIGSQSMPIDWYMLDNWVYMKISIPGAGEQWAKVKMDQQQWDQRDQLAQQMQFLKTAANVTVAGQESVDGVDSYVLSVNPDMRVLSEWVLSQQQDSNLDLGNLDLSKMFKTFTVKEWISKRTFLPVRAQIDVVLEMSPPDVGASAHDFEKIALEMNMKYKFFDYNKPITVTLPEAAKNAVEMPEGHP